MCVCVHMCGMQGRERLCVIVGVICVWRGGGRGTGVEGPKRISEYGMCQCMCTYMHGCTAGYVVSPPPSLSHTHTHTHLAHVSSVSRMHSLTMKARPRKITSLDAVLMSNRAG